jgi:hypothetical protein
VDVATGSQLVVVKQLNWSLSEFAKPQSSGGEEKLAHPASSI